MDKALSSYQWFSKWGRWTYGCGPGGKEVVDQNKFGNHCCDTAVPKVGAVGRSRKMVIEKEVVQGIATN